MTKSVGVALGGGGAKGLAHVAILEMLDDMGVEISAVAGTSIGAIIGSAYASGRSAAELRVSLDELLAMPQTFQEIMESKRLFGWLDLLNVEFGKAHILETHAFVSKMQSYVGVETFEELRTPLQVVAADFWERSEVVFDSGPLIPAVSASFCLPGVFKPIVIDGRVLIDGGCVNPVPFDLLRERCDVVVAVDVLGKRVPDDDLMPSFSEALFNTFQIAESSIAQEKMKTHPPDIYLEPEIRDVKMLEFQKSEQIYSQTTPECLRLRSELSDLLEA